MFFQNQREQELGLRGNKNLSQSPTTCLPFPPRTPGCMGDSPTLLQ
uniref:Uncharacterized protein n=1 Tax=Rhizophora mucronata TaxID=61149 RepID=A0A2P2NK47_RHIMU